MRHDLQCVKRVKNGLHQTLKFYVTLILNGKSVLFPTLLGSLFVFVVEQDGNRKELGKLRSFFAAISLP